MKKKKKKTKFDLNKWFKKQDTYFQFFLCIISLLLVLILFRIVYIASGVIEEVGVDTSITTEQISVNNEDYNIDVEYPKFKNIYVKKIITNYVFDYVYQFKESNKRLGKTNSSLKIDYDITFFNNYLIIYFDIENSLDSSRINKSIIVDTKESVQIKNSEFFTNPNTFKEIIISKGCKKYDKTICKRIKNTNIEDYDIKLVDSNVTVTFNNMNTGLTISYIPEVSVNIEDIEDTSKYQSLKVFNEIKSEEVIPAKYIAFTFDDGPNSKITNQVIDALLENNSTATFFELGMNMKHNRAIVQRLNAVGMEVGNHSYSHAYLPNCTKKQYLSEINTTNLIFNDITEQYITLLRVPYGASNKMIRKNSPYPLINWSVDTRDWYSRNAKKIYKHILKNAKDGDIVLMHDIYSSTAEAVRMALPELNARGYKVVSVSELARIKGKTLKKGKVYRKIK